MGLTYGILRSVIALVIGIVLLVLGVQAWATTFDFLSHATPATAHVVGSRRYVDDKGNVSYCPVLSFRTHAGRAITVQGQNVCQSSPFAGGTLMAIHYRTDRPSSVEVDGFTGTWFTPVAFSALGLLLTAVPVLYLRRKWRAAHPRPAPAVVAAMAADAAMPGPTSAEMSGSLWATPSGKLLGEDYIARLLARPADAPAMSAAPDEDITAYDAILSEVPDDSHDGRRRAALEGRILALYRKGDYWRAMDDVKSLIEAYRAASDAPDRGRWDYFCELPGVWYIPHSEAMYHYAGGLLAMFLDDAEGALDELRRSIDIEPAYAPAHHALGIAYRRRGDLDAALRAYTQALRLDPTSAPALYATALVYRQRRDARKAAEYLDRALAADPTNERYRAARDELSAGTGGRRSA